MKNLLPQISEELRLKKLKKLEKLEDICVSSIRLNSYTPELLHSLKKALRIKH